MNDNVRYGIHVIVSNDASFVVYANCLLAVGSLQPPKAPLNRFGHFSSRNERTSSDMS